MILRNNDFSTINACLSKSWVVNQQRNIAQFGPVNKTGEKINKISQDSQLLAGYYHYNYRKNSEHDNDTEPNYIYPYVCAWVSQYLKFELLMEKNK